MLFLVPEFDIETSQDSATTEWTLSRQLNNKLQDNNIASCMTMSGTFRLSFNQPFSRRMLVRLLGPLDCAPPDGVEVFVQDEPPGGCTECHESCALVDQVGGCTFICRKFFVKYVYISIAVASTVCKIIA